MTPQQHLKAELEKYVKPLSTNVTASILKAMRAHTNEVLGELENWVDEVEFRDSSEIWMVGVGGLKAKIQSLKT